MFIAPAYNQSGFIFTELILPVMANTIQRLAIAIMVLIGAACSMLNAQTGTLPKFEDYRTSDKLKGKPVPAKPQSAEAKLYRTAIKEGAKEGPNFAGSYTVVTWGCGTACLMFAIVDGRTGKVFVAPFTVSMGEHLEQEEDLIEFHPDSKLLIVTGDINEKNYGKYFYKWDKGRLTLLRRSEAKPVNSGN
ncbi:MAG: hypothetical protein JST22_18950 [Bacteroidetes bacterium]|nr:hypothetical protein [Bacteroidota bacterium]